LKTENHRFSASCGTEKTFDSRDARIGARATSRKAASRAVAEVAARRREVAALEKTWMCGNFSGRRAGGVIDVLV